MKKLFSPDYILKSYSELTPEFLSSLGFDALVLDIDNTLLPYEIALPTDELLSWFRTMDDAKIKIAFVSNNNKQRVELFNSSIQYTAFYKSKKPLLKTMKKALAVMGASPEKTALMGDQIFTDVFAGKRMGFVTFLVPPIKDKTDAFTRAKRFFEKPIIKNYYKRMDNKK